MNLIKITRLIALLACLPVASLFAQTPIDWQTLADVKFKQKFSEETGINYDEATFGR